MKEASQEAEGNAFAIRSFRSFSLHGVTSTLVRLLLSSLFSFSSLRITYASASLPHHAAQVAALVMAVPSASVAAVLPDHHHHSLSRPFG